MGHSPRKQRTVNLSVQGAAACTTTEFPTRARPGISPGWLARSVAVHTRYFCSVCRTQTCNKQQNKRLAHSVRVGFGSRIISEYLRMEPNNEQKVCFLSDWLLEQPREFRSTWVPTSPPPPGLCHTCTVQEGSRPTIWRSSPNLTECTPPHPKRNGMGEVGGGRRPVPNRSVQGRPLPPPWPALYGYGPQAGVKALSTPALAGPWSTVRSKVWAVGSPLSAWTQPAAHVRGHESGARVAWRRLRMRGCATGATHPDGHFFRL